MVWKISRIVLAWAIFPLMLVAGFIAATFCLLDNDKEAFDKAWKDVFYPMVGKDAS